MSAFRAVYVLNQQAIVTGGLNPTGAYDNSHAYSKGDSVSYSGSSYVAIQSTTGNLPTNTTYWQLLAQIGNTGANGSLVISVKTKTANYTMTNSDDLILADTSGGAWTLTLPDATICTVKRYAAKLVKYTGTLTINSVAGLIDGSASITVNVLNTSLEFATDGTNWNLL